MEWTHVGWLTLAGLGCLLAYGLLRDVVRPRRLRSLPEQDGAAAQGDTADRLELSLSDVQLIAEPIRQPSEPSDVRPVSPAEPPASDPRSDAEIVINALLRAESQVATVTGRAGTGKSTLLRTFREKAKELGKQVVVVAPTGLAALNVGGQTIHSFFRFAPQRPVDPDKLRPVQNRELIKHIDALIIDEISMLRVDLLGGIDRFMRINGRDPGRPFGGCQTVLFGDPYQLPPIVSSPEEWEFIKSRWKSEWFFDAHAIGAARPALYWLRHVYRQADPEFIRVLDELRTATPSPATCELLNRRVSPAPDDAVHLTTTKDLAGEINQRCFNALTGYTREYRALVAGTIPNEDQRPTESNLNLRRGAPVIFVRNDPAGRWVNGTRGVVEFLGDGFVRVNVDGTVHDIEPVTWETVSHRFDREKRTIETTVVGTFTQLPLRLAWALTIHKAQGMTLKKVHVNLGSGAFAPGQVYVALSRCTSLEGLTLERPLRVGEAKLAARLADFEALFASFV